MIAQFTARTTRGHGRGKGLGFPTINMVLPENLSSQMKQGVYAARAEVGGKKYGGALFYGKATTFNDTDIALEIFLLDAPDFSVASGESIDIEVLEFIRPSMTFDSPELLTAQMQKDETAIRNILCYK